MLRLQAQGGHRAGFEPAYADLLAGFAAIAIAAVINTQQGGVYFAEQLALAVAGPEFQAEFLFLGRPVGGIGKVGGVFFHVVHRAVHLFHQLMLPVQQDLPEMLKLRLIHIFLALFLLIGRDGLLFGPGLPSARFRRALRVATGFLGGHDLFYGFLFGLNLFGSLLLRFFAGWHR